MTLAFASGDFTDGGVLAELAWLIPVVPLVAAGLSRTSAARRAASSSNSPIR